MGKVLSVRRNAERSSFSLITPGQRHEGEEEQKRQKQAQNPQPAALLSPQGQLEDHGCDPSHVLLQEVQKEQKLQSAALLLPQQRFEEREPREPNPGAVQKQQQGQNRQPAALLLPHDHAEELHVEPNHDSLEEEQYEEDQQEEHEMLTSLTVERARGEEFAEQKPWIDIGYVKPSQEVKSEGLAILDPANYSGFKDLDVNMARLHFQHELPPGYSIIRRIGRGAFGCCFLVKKVVKQGELVLKVVSGMIEPRSPVIFYKSCSLYTLMISEKGRPLILENLKFILGMLKFLHTEQGEVHGDLNPGNMLYIVHRLLTKEKTIQMCALQQRRQMLAGGGLSLLPKTFLNLSITLPEFLDHWFAIHDECSAHIIDADIGGKIGEAKIIVNHQHHDPRNATWQASDDLIGLMNWVVIKTGHHVQSHPTHGIVYDISLESLRYLHEHIIGLYRDLDNHFIYDYLDAPQEPFPLMMRSGECYLDELLVGKFLHFESFEGSYSLASTTASVTSCVKLEVLEVMQAVPVIPADLCHVFLKIASGKDKYLATLNTVLNLLTSHSLHGGAVFVLLDKKHKNDLQILPLDNGLLNQLCRSKANRVNNPFFSHILHAFCAPSETDRWEQSLLEELAANCEDSSLEMSPKLAALNMQPKDGAFVLSRSGTVLAAAAHLKFLPQHYQLCKANGMHFGTRHAAALATAEWMRLKHVDGTVFVRSDAGEVHVMLPHGQALSKPKECPWISEDGQKLPQVLCIEGERKDN